MTHHSRHLHFAQPCLRLTCAPSRPATCQAAKPLVQQLAGLGVEVWLDPDTRSAGDQQTHKAHDVKSPGDFQPLALEGLFWPPHSAEPADAVLEQLQARHGIETSKPLILFSDQSQALELGAQGLALVEAWLPLTPKRSDVLRTLQVLQLGGCYYPKALRRALQGGSSGQPNQDKVPALANLHADLTPRELEIWALVQQGCTSREIAEHLDISTRTVDAHRRSLKQKQASLATRLAA